jgi:predicted glycosyltransferase
MLRDSDTKTVLGLRDVMDSPENLEREWAARDTLARMQDYYDRIWVYGPERFWNPLVGLDVPESLAERVRHVGFLRRELPTAHPPDMHFLPDEYVLVTAGGGGDGSALMEQVLAARESDHENDFPLVLVLGPFMKSENRERIRLRASTLGNITVIDFEARLELLLNHASGVIGMCGYNTFCEALSFDQKALFVPRTHPRQEQYIRANRARELGLCEMLTPEEAAVPQTMARALNHIIDMARPSAALLPDDLSGLDVICDDVEQLVSNKRVPASTKERISARVSAFER